MRYCEACENCNENRGRWKKHFDYTVKFVVFEMLSFSLSPPRSLVAFRNSSASDMPYGSICKLSGQRKAACHFLFTSKRFRVVRERICQALLGSSEKSEGVALQFKYSAVKIMSTQQRRCEANIARYSEFFIPRFALLFYHWRKILPRETHNMPNLWILNARVLIRPSIIEIFSEMKTVKKDYVQSPNFFR